MLHAVRKPLSSVARNRSEHGSGKRVLLKQGKNHHNVDTGAREDCS